MVLEYKFKKRWDPYSLIDNSSFTIFWHDYLHTTRKRVLYILGLGFDPRMLLGIQTIMQNSPFQESCDCLLITYDEGPDSTSNLHRDLISKNYADIKKLVPHFRKYKEKKIGMLSDDLFHKRRIGDIEAISIIDSFEEINDYTDVIIDISALPRGIYFSLVAKILHLLHERSANNSTKCPNLFVIVSENVELDKRIEDSGVDEEPKYISGFSSDLERSATNDIPIIWIPVLGENKKIQLERTHSWLMPSEICPVVPSPSINPRRGDDLVIEYHSILFDEWVVEPKNIIFADERNPFDLYRQIIDTVLRYDAALAALKGLKVVISSDSSKLISVGALLAAYDLKKNMRSVGLANIEPRGYDILEKENIDKINRNSELFALLLFHEDE
ncbi:hypothetical protein F8E02_02315 [Methanoculleus sp. Wushi-C6]|uniref:Uncharacterized protein n=1 Tax=Methanoculleus caldifontis TaxID=2651577 RepID=A0ABU3WZS1_9EURY|nr:hypothetical protein [Methanoculleus sp. Wushi-C6]MDV2480857.1 hypothetical protein [Methanoculleus sp. Wushi-C6]